MIKNSHSSEEDKIQHDKNHKSIVNILGLSKHVCLNGLDASSIPLKSYIPLFAAGPCSPVVLIPGIAGSKLIAEIECDTVQAQHPEVFKSCGWNTCDKTKAGKGRWVMPDREYKMWIPEFDSVMSISKPFKNNQNCFANVMGMVIKQINVPKPNSAGAYSIKLQVSSLSGVNIYPYGSSLGTRNYFTGQCGFDAVENLLPV